ncbi:MAG TPA: cytochrome c oxidase subunit II [Solirubrobacterales bacterium]|nr:cytochrome c oxidase subunit II [Solirubrobacterales bacterium]
MSLFIALAGFLTGMGVLAGPAMALSLNPEAGSPGIEKANTFHWIIFVVIVIAIVAVNLAIIRAARPRNRHVPNGGSARKGSQLKVGLGLGVVALAIFVTATVFSDQSRVVPVSTETVADVNESKQLEIVATGQQWLWRFNYPNGAFSYHRLVVPAGVTVALKLVSTDVIHGWNVPSLTGKADAVPGKTNWVYFRADEEGVHTGRSAILSGQGYDTMEAKVEVVSPDEYETFIEQLKTDIQDAQDAVEQTNHEGAAATTDVSAGALKDDAQDKTMKTAEKEQ